MNLDATLTKSDLNDVEPPRTVAVIDIGSTSVRMQISEIGSSGEIRNLESFSQAVSLGKDSFVNGSIKQSTIEDCVNVLKIYRVKLNEYEINDDNLIRVIATSGVKEARNRLAFQDRVFIATGFAIEPFDEAELHRVTYLGVLPLFKSHPEVFAGNVVVCEVGGGTTEVLVLNNQDVEYSQTLRLGAIRLRTALESLSAPNSRNEEILEAQILQAIRQLPDAIFENPPDWYIAMGSEVRFAASEIKPDRSQQSLVELEYPKLAKFISETNLHSPDAIATKYHFSLPDAESLGPSLLVHQILARELGAKQFFAAKVNLRDGMLQEMARGRAWSESIQRQVVRSANLIGQKFNVNRVHSGHVAYLACELFDQLEQLHQLPIAMRGLLEVAAHLHEVGLFVSTRSYHKHSSYLIRNSEFFGIGSAERDLVALVARYHRRATPQPGHDIYSGLSRIDRVSVAKLAAILRIAKALDASRKQKIKSIRVRLVGNKIVISTPQVADFSLEQLHLKQDGSFFENIFGYKIVLQEAAINPYQ